MDDKAFNDLTLCIKDLMDDAAAKVTEKQACFLMGMMQFNYERLKAIAYTPKWGLCGNAKKEADNQGRLLASK